MAKKSPEALLAEAESIAQVQLKLHSQPKPTLDPKEIEYWAPGLGPGQQRIFDSTARFNLAHGERFSGKTVGILHKLVKHAWENHAAHVLIIVGVRRQATAGGAWTKLLRDILPQWEQNLEGFSFGDPRMTTEKDVILEIANQHGTKSIFHLISIPHGGKLADRIKGIEPTAIFVDELVGIGGLEYFTALIQQLGRRVDIPISEQFYAAATNPAGPSHWVYKIFIGGGTNEDGTPFLGGAIKPDGSWDEKFLTVHIPISENPDPRAQEYYRDFVLPAVQNDPIEYQRMVEGKWIDRPSGEAIFAGSFVPDFHVRGDPVANTILRPTTDRSLTLSYDLGDVNHAVVFLQDRFTEDKTIWMAVDELVSTDKKMEYSRLVPLLLDKMNFWCELEQHSFRFEHISDRSAFDRWRATTGSYDHQTIEKLSKELLKKFPERWPWLKVPIRMKECPKPPGSVAARIKVLRELLQNESFFISGPKCPRLIGSLKFLESKKDDPMAPVKGPHLHPYDACSYALYYNALGGGIVVPQNADPIKPQVTSIGS